MGSQTQKQLEALDIPIACVQHAAVRGLFETAFSQGNHKSEEAKAAVKLCLVHKSQVAHCLDEVVVDEYKAVLSLHDLFTSKNFSDKIHSNSVFSPWHTHLQAKPHTMAAT